MIPRPNLVGTGVHHPGAEAAEGPGAAARRLRRRLQRRPRPGHGAAAAGGAAAARGEGAAVPGGHGADVRGKCGATHQFLGMGNWFSSFRMFFFCEFFCWVLLLQFLVEILLEDPKKVESC